MTSRKGAAAALGAKHSGRAKHRDRAMCEGHLRASVRAFVEDYHEERPHQGLGNTLIAPKMTVIGTGQMKCRERLCGLLKFYDREAA
jgi:hypothetical protein